MSMLWRFGRLGLLSSALAACAAFPMKERFVVYYNDEASVDKFDDFQLVVLDSDVHPKIEDFSRRKTVLGYLSIGEVREGAVKDAMPEEVIVKKNENWDSHIVDIRQPVWYRYVLDEAVPAILKKGFNGVMLDTIDSALYLESQEPEKYKGTKEAALYIIRSIRHNHPEIKIMMNRAFEILPDVAEEIDMVLAESILSHYDLNDDIAKTQEDEVYLHYVEKILSAKALSKGLSVYTLDYWDMNDKKGVAYIYSTQRAKGFVPYVSTPDLRKIHLEGNASGFSASESDEVKAKGRVDA
ncbi:MAG: endo alpha-1,4 polygalactosaminidase [Rickettsiales bacterium]|nr:endo alpha-1,4 polygalactosaminidase [Rickettsiales bacterium]